MPSGKSAKNPEIELGVSIGTGHRALRPERRTRAWRRRRGRLQRRADPSKATSTRVSLYRGAVITRPRSFSGTWRNPSIYLTLLVLSTRRNEAPGVPEAPQSPPLIHLSGTRRAHGIERHRASDFLAGALR
jgi:hypothetical protein